ncbi:hypothetical protein EDC56_1281 [Sinobacterium caligoides]|uniref:Uncharacterized protein n=1 Tax=Sinobacterium caligoides TaxID=933926 RepID=A0A3N2E0U8_9GAMM|nr:hypothetical protein [Sinobacterium caligoides]ROS05730.1 hypothetical protein EDC56_1281 [Sinobacterium caligoides]
MKFSKHELKVMSRTLTAGSTMKSKALAYADEIAQAYLAGHSLRILANDYDVSRTAITSALDSKGVKRRSQQESNRLGGGVSMIKTKKAWQCANIIAEEYREGYTPKEIGDKWGISPFTARRIVISTGQKTRSVRESHSASNALKLKNEKLRRMTSTQ